MCDLGGRYLDGKGVRRSESVGLSWYTKAVEMGEPSAMIELGRRYLDGDGLHADQSMGLAWYAKAAEWSGSAILDLGQRYMEGAGVDENRSVAAVWFWKGADDEIEECEQELEWLATPNQACGVSRPLV
jgi:TPR repeat protein